MPRRSPGTGTIGHLKGQPRPWKASRIVSGTTEMQSFERKGDAEKWLVSREGVTSKGTTVASVAEDWLGRKLAENARGTLSTSLYKGYEGLIRLYVIDVLGSKLISEVKPRDIDAMLAGTKLAASSLRKLRTTTNQVFAFALGQGHCAVNPVTLAQPIRDESKLGTARIALSPAQELALRERCAEMLGGDYIALILDTGARPSEVLALRWSDLNFAKSTVRLEASIGAPKLDAPIARKVMKTKTARRTIPVNPRALAPLQARRGDAHAEALVFGTVNGRPQDHRNVSGRWLAPIAKAAGIAHVNLYDLRHTHATRLMEKGVPGNGI